MKALTVAWSSYPGATTGGVTGSWAAGVASRRVIYPPALESDAQCIGAQVLVQERVGTPEWSVSRGRDLQYVDVDFPKLIRPRPVGVEHVGLRAMEQLGLRTLFEELGMGSSMCAAAVGSIIARMAQPGSERAARRWLGEGSALDELLGVMFATLGPIRLYRASDAWSRSQAESGANVAPSRSHPLPNRVRRAMLARDDCRIGG